MQGIPTWDHMESHAFLCILIGGLMSTWAPNVMCKEYMDVYLTCKYLARYVHPFVNLLYACVPSACQIYVCADDVECSTCHVNMSVHSVYERVCVYTWRVRASTHLYVQCMCLYLVYVVCTLNTLMCKCVYCGCRHVYVRIDTYTHTYTIVHTECDITLWNCKPNRAV